MDRRGTHISPGSAELIAEQSAVAVHIPSALRNYSRGASELEINAGCVRSLLAEMECRYPALYRNVCDETGAVRRHVNVFVNNSNIRDRQGLDTPLVKGDAVIILPAVSGG